MSNIFKISIITNIFYFQPKVKINTKGFSHFHSFCLTVKASWGNSLTISLWQRQSKMAHICLPCILCQKIQGKTPVIAKGVFVIL